VKGCKDVVMVSVFDIKSLRWKVTLFVQIEVQGSLQWRALMLRPILGDWRQQGGEPRVSERSEQIQVFTNKVISKVIDTQI
jgi:hypothetical protein